MSFISTAIYLAVAASWLYALVFLLLFVENRRFWRSRTKLVPPRSDGETPRCMLVIPCKGIEHRLAENLSGFLRQDHTNYEVTFVVESAQDPATRLIRKLMDESRCVKTRLVIAGPCEDTGQKVHNLRAATANLDAEIEVIVFADSDAGAKSTWLRWLVAGIGDRNLGAKTGYRWMAPRDNKLTTLIGCSINNAVASMLGPGKHFLVWGGSWAIHRKIFDTVALRDAWSGSLSDDLVASRVLALSDLNVKFEPQCVCTSYVTFTAASLTEFLTRQLIIARIYAPKYWSIAAAVTLLSQAGFWGGLIAGISLIVAGSSVGYWLLGSCAGLYFLSAARATIRQSIGRLACDKWHGEKKARHFDVLAGPLNGLVLTAAMIRSMFGNTIVWRQIGYFIGNSGKIQLLGRRMQKQPWPIETGSALPESVPFQSADALTNELPPPVDAQTNNIKKSA